MFKLFSTCLEVQPIRVTCNYGTFSLNKLKQKGMKLERQRCIEPLRPDLVSCWFSLPSLHLGVGKTESVRWRHLKEDTLVNINIQIILYVFK